MTEMIIRGLNELIFSPRPYFCVIGDLRIGPNCLGSPASTSWPPLWWLGSRRSATGMMHSGSVACPASSIKMCVKWLRGKQAETNLGKWFWNKKVKSLLAMTLQGSWGSFTSRCLGNRRKSSLWSFLVTEHSKETIIESFLQISKGKTPKKHSTVIMILFLSIAYMSKKELKAKLQRKAWKKQ